MSLSLAHDLSVCVLSLSLKRDLWDVSIPPSSLSLTFVSLCCLLDSAVYGVSLCVVSVSKM